MIRSTVNTHPAEGLAIAFCIGSNYWPHVATAIKSLIDTANSSMPDIYVFYETQNPRWQGKIASLARQKDTRIEFREFNIDDVKDFKGCSYLGLSAYFRIFIPQILADYEKILYLDSDLLILHDLCELFTLDLAGNALAARPVLWRDELLKMSEGIGMGPDMQYFNSGVLLIDTFAWNKLELTQTLVTIITENSDLLTYADQDALNIAAKGRFKQLYSHWNVSSMYYEPTSEDKILNGRASEVASAARDPRVVHFTGAIKPWHYNCKHPLRHLYIETRQTLHRHPYQLLWLAKSKLHSIRSNASSTAHALCGKIARAVQF